MTCSKVLLQLDPDRHASAFDALVAIDAGVDHLLSYSQVAPEDVPELVHGAIFTRGPENLSHTAIFIGGSNVLQAEQLLRHVQSSFLGPLRVSVMIDAHGANTTATAAVLMAQRHLPLPGLLATVLAATGPVGQRVVRLLYAAGATVRVVSRQQQRADATCQQIESAVNATPGAGPPGTMIPLAVSTEAQLASAVQDASLVVAAGAAGVPLLPRDVWRSAPALRVAIDLNAVPPTGIEGVAAHAEGAAPDGWHAYGALGVGKTKMKIHRAAVQQLFQSRDQVLDAEQIYRLALGMLR